MTPKQKTNHKSILTGRSGFLPFHGLDENRDIGPELFDQAAIDAWLSTKQGSTARSALSRLRWWQDRYRTLIHSQELPFEPVALAVGISNLGIKKFGSTFRLSKETGLDYRSLIRMGEGNAITCLATAVQLERALELLPGSITSRMHRQHRTNAFCSRSRMPASLWAGASKSLADHRVQRLRHLLPEDFPLRSEADQSQLIHSASQSVLRSLKRARSSKSLRYGLPMGEMPPALQHEMKDFLHYLNAPSHELHRDGLKRQNADPVRPATQKTWQTELRLFFGWCVLPSEAQLPEQTVAPDPMMLGAGLTRDDLTLGLLAVPELVQDYLEWRSYVRSTGVSMVAITLIRRCLSLNHPETGYLVQNPDILKRIPARFLRPVAVDYKKQLEEELDRYRAQQERLARLKKLLN